jgi:signal transduction histidine kinase
MKRLFWVLWASLSLTLLAFLFFVAGFPGETRRVTLSQAVIMLDNSETPPAVFSGEVIRLPDMWRLSRPDFHGAAWYRLSLPPGLPDAEPVGVVALTVIGRMSIWQGGQRLSSGVSRNDNGRMGTQAGFYVELANTSDDLFLRVEGWRLLQPGIGVLAVGPLAEVELAFAVRQHIVISGSIVMLTICFLSGLWAAFVWQLNPSDQRFLWFAIFGGLISMVIFLGMLIDSGYDYLSPRLHLTITLAGYAVLSVAKFIFETAGLRKPIFGRGLFAVAVIILLPLPVLYQPTVPFPYALWVDGIMVLVGIVCVWTMLRAFITRPSTPIIMLLIGCALTLGVGVQSILQAWVVQFSGMPPLAQFGPLPLIAAMGAVLLTRLRWQQLRIAAANRRLARRIAARERELGQSHARILTLEVQRATEVERSQMTRDMHDGLGNQLVTSIRMAERGSLSQIETVQLLRETLDELRIVIDASSADDAEFDDQLAKLGRRMTPRFQTIGVDLAWDVSDAGHLHLDRKKRLSLLRVIQEALTNCLKHAQASRVTVSDTWENDTYVLQVADNGVGMSSRQPGGGGYGHKNMQRRMTELGGSLEVISADNGTTIRIELSAGLRTPARDPGA